MSPRSRFLTDAWLESQGVEHGFGMRGATPPPDLVRPNQVHGRCVARVDDDSEPTPWDADAIVTDRAGEVVGIVTADCVPILLAAANGTVGAVHAGWRGLALGVVERGVAEVRRLGGEITAAAIGPYIGPCCYEVDAPVIDALSERFGSEVGAAVLESRPGHYRLDLGWLVGRDLLRADIPEPFVSKLPDACTFCDAHRFHSYRRDGAGAGRLVHFVVGTAIEEGPQAGKTGPT